MVFKNKHNEVRSGIKIILVILMAFAITFLVSMVIGIILAVVLMASQKGNISLDMSPINDFLASDAGNMINGVLSNSVFILSCIILWKAFEKKKVREMGLINIKEGYKELIMGLVIGAMTMSVVAIVLLLVGNVKLMNPVSKPQISSALFTGLILFIFVGFGEEILGRGYIMSVLKQTRNKWAVLIISALIFAALHLANNGISILAFINLTLVGMLFGYMFMKSKNIWMPIGYHITWNYFQGYVWGFQVSGTTSTGLYSIKNVSDNLINGGAFGPEGGIVVTIITCIAFYCVHLYYKDKKVDDFIDKVDNKEIEFSK